MPKFKRGSEEEVTRKYSNTGWSETYELLKNSTIETSSGRTRITWQKAALVAWDAAPREKRLPKTLAELAVLLGFTVQAIHAWRRQEWYQIAIETFTANVFVANMLAVYDRIINAALEETGAVGIKAREQFLDMVDRIRERESLDKQIEAQLMRILEERESSKGDDI